MRPNILFILVDGLRHDQCFGVGIRTQNYKYFRNSRDSGIDVNLYDLKNDNQ